MTNTMWHGLGPNPLWRCISINFSKFFVCITSAYQKFKGTMGSSFLCAIVFLKLSCSKLVTSFYTKLDIYNKELTS